MKNNNPDLNKRKSTLNNVFTELVSKKDLIDVLGLNKLGLVKRPIATFIMKLTKLDKVNTFYNSIKDKRGKEFFEAFVKERNIKYTVYQQDLNKIPRTGPFILVANHPLGAIDGVLMTKILSDIRPDFRIMGNFLLGRVAPMKPYLISVNPFGSRKNVKNNLSATREALKHLQDGGCIGIFPAGEVSNRNNQYGAIRDKPWESAILKLIRAAKVPVIPMYFHAENSKLFYRMARFHPDLQTVMLPAEMMRNRKDPIKIRIGRIVSAKVLAEQTPKEIDAFLQKKIHILRHYYEKQKSVQKIFKLLDKKRKLTVCKQESTVQNIIDETPTETLITDIARISAKGNMIFRNGNYELYFSNFEDIPFIMREIGRQREIAFRAIGEGTNFPFDLDEFDKHYYHLFLWDSHKQTIAGAYRMAFGREIMTKYGINGFYTASLFDFDPELSPFFNRVIEMGRAYITPEYQRKPLPLSLLWRGIIHICLRNPDYHFLMGGVSISNKFCDFSKSVMIEFMRSHYFDAAMAQFVHPKNEYKIHLTDLDKSALFFQEMQSDLNLLDKLIDDLEPQLRMPVLIKKYFEQNAKVIAFNVDPSFNDAIDGLMYIRISDIPEDTLKPVLKEMSEKEG